MGMCGLQFKALYRGLFNVWGYCYISLMKNQIENEMEALSAFEVLSSFGKLSDEAAWGLLGYNYTCHKKQVRHTAATSQPTGSGIPELTTYCPQVSRNLCAPHARQHPKHSSSRGLRA